MLIFDPIKYINPSKAYLQIPMQFYKYTDILNMWEN